MSTLLYFAWQMVLLNLTEPLTFGQAHLLQLIRFFFVAQERWDLFLFFASVERQPHEHICQMHFGRYPLNECLDRQYLFK